MIKSTNNRFFDREPALGYSYQARLAPLKLLQLLEESAVLLESDDDLDLAKGLGAA